MDTYYVKGIRMLSQDGTTPAAYDNALRTGQVLPTMQAAPTPHTAPTLGDRLTTLVQRAHLWLLHRDLQTVQKAVAAIPAEEQALTERSYRRWAQRSADIVNESARRELEGNQRIRELEQKIKWLTGADTRHYPLTKGLK